LAEAPLFICRSRSYLDWLSIVLVMGMVWRRRWWRFIIGGINRPLIFMAIFAWNIGSSSATEGYQKISCWLSGSNQWDIDQYGGCQGAESAESSVRCESGRPAGGK